VRQERIGVKVIKFEIKHSQYDDDDHEIEIDACAFRGRSDGVADHDVMAHSRESCCLIMKERMDGRLMVHL
jgi:hypothetical protein